eukprot:c28695_g1_i1 orf=124-2559(+)
MDVWLRDRDEDLALFSDMRCRERKSFLHPSSDDIGASLSIEFGEPPGDCFSVSTPSTHTDAFDLFTENEEKSDYDWLMTPPGTPLFPLLDHDIQTVNLSQKRTLSQSISDTNFCGLSQSGESSPRILHGSSGLHLANIPGCTSGKISTKRGRAEFPSIPCPSPTLQSPRASGQLHTPIGRATRIVGRSTRCSTPTRYQTDAKHTIQSSAAGKNGSRNRGNSLSQKLQASHPLYPPEFSSESSLNLSSSIKYDSTPSSQGSSFILRNERTGRDNSPCSYDSEAQQKMLLPPSTNVSRTSTSSYSHDLYNCQTSKGSIMYSCDDDIDISKPTFLHDKRGDMDCTFAVTKSVRKGCVPQGGKYCGQARRQPRSTASAQIPILGGITNKKSIGQTMHHLDHPRSQTMFRPLLSNVSASTFYNIRSSMMQQSSTDPKLESEIDLEESCNGVFVDAPAATDNSKSVFLLTSETGRVSTRNSFVEKPTLYTEGTASMGKKEESQMCSRDDSRSEISHELTNASICALMSSFSCYGNESLTAIENFPGSVSSIFSRQESPDLSLHGSQQEIVVSAEIERRRNVSLDDCTLAAWSEQQLNDSESFPSSIDEGQLNPSQMSEELDASDTGEMMSQCEWENISLQNDLMSGECKHALIIEGDTAGKCQSESPSPPSGFTAEERTETILFCASIVHEIIYKAATIAIQKQENNSADNPIGARKPVAAQVIPAAGCKNLFGGTWKGQSVRLGPTVHHTLTCVQKNTNLIHHQASSIMHRHYLMDKTGNAVIQNQEDDVQNFTKLSQNVPLKITKGKARCCCSVM